MLYRKAYFSPLGEMTMVSDGTMLTALSFLGQKYYDKAAPAEAEEGGLSVFCQTKEWLDIYFGGQRPDFIPPFAAKGTEFQEEVWDILKQIPYGQVITYGEIAGQIAERRGIKRMSAQAVGGAVGRNPIAIIVPCHRVIGADGSLTGYAGGMDKKAELLKLEGSVTECCQCKGRGCD